MRHNWRGVQEWNKDGIILSTTSNEASKLFDASLNQFLGWFDDDSVGGLENSMKKMKEADPNFVLGQCLAFGIEFMGTEHNINCDKFKQRIDCFTKLGETQTLSYCEQQHVEAIKYFAKNDFYSASKCYEKILVECPQDIFALKMAQDSYFFLGLLPELKDSVARVAPVWEAKNIPLKSYLNEITTKSYFYGMYAFGLEENHFYRKAESEARKGLQLNANDSWATHALAHVFEMEGRTSEGL
ncbi:Tetratricopeptide repeat protein 38-like protein, partial [Leptotrombidium deliense]